MGKAGKTKFYAVLQGRKPGVYETWPEAQAQVNGFPKAKHQAFKTRGQAEAFLAGSSAPSSSAFSSTRSAATTSSSASGSSLRSKPYDRPFSTGSSKSRSQGSNPAKPQFQRRALEMKWSPRIEAELIRTGWLVVFTDGACQGNGKRRAVSGAGVFWANPRNTPGLSERVPNKQTNQCAELYAILRALETDPEPAAPLHIFTDSSYSIQCLTDWINLWMKRGWKTTSGEPVDNAELIKLIHFMISKREGPVELSWVRGHANIPGNTMADKLATQGADRVVAESRDFEAEREERFRDFRDKAKRVTTVPAPQENDTFDEAWLLSHEEELEELEDEDSY